MTVDSRKFLAVGALLLVIATLAVNGATSREATIVKDVSFDSHGDSLEAKITATGESKYTYFELKQPRRLVVDFLGIQNTIKFREKKILYKHLCSGSNQAMQPTADRSYA